MMTSVPIGASKSTTGLLSGGGEGEGKDEGDNSIDPPVTPAAASNKSWFGGNGNDTNSNSNSNSNINSNNNNNNNNNNNGTPKWKRMPWSRPAHQDASTAHFHAEATTRETAAPSWATTASSARSMGGSDDYGGSDHLEGGSNRNSNSNSNGVRHSLSSAWNTRRSRVVLPSMPQGFRRRQTTNNNNNYNNNNNDDDDCNGNDDDDTAAAMNAHLSFYGGLLSTPPSSITFVIHRRPIQTKHQIQTPATTDAGIIDDETSAGNGNSISNSKSNSRKKLRDLLGVRLVKTLGTHHQFQVVREDWEEDEDNDNDESEKNNNSSNESESESNDDEPQPSFGAPLLPQELTVLLRPGDFLESVDGIAVGGRNRRTSTTTTTSSSIMSTLGNKYKNYHRCWDEEDLYKSIILAATNAVEKTAEATGVVSSDNQTQTETDTTNNNNNNENDQSGLGYPTITLTFVCCGRTTRTTPSSPSSESPSPSSSPSSSPTDQTTTAMDSSSFILPLSSKTSETTPSVTLTTIDASSSKTPPKASNTNTKTPMVHKAYFVDQSREKPNRDDENTTVEGLVEEFLRLETIQKSIEDPSKSSSRFRRMGNNNKNNNYSNKVATSLLHIGSIPRNSNNNNISHWLGKQTKIKTGDVLLCADDIPCYNGELSPGDLSQVWKTALLTKVLVSDSIEDPILSTSKATAASHAHARATSYVGITTCTIPLTSMQIIRRRAVAVGGGALVGTGAVLMITPLHPVGHAMAIGGLGVLGTEFEGPKKAFQKAKQSAANLAAKMKKTPVASEGEATATEDISESPASSSSAVAAVTKPSSKNLSDTNQEEEEVIVIND